MLHSNTARGSKKNTKAGVRATSSDDETKDKKVVILGGGLQGLASAYFLCCKRGCTNVTLVERCDKVAPAASGKAGGFLAGGWGDERTRELHTKSFQLHEQLAEELDLGDRIRLLGHVPDAGKLVRVFDLFVLPSGSAEAFGLVLLEAMSAGVPVLTSTAPGPSEVVGQVSCQFLEGNADHLANKILELSRWSDEQRASVVLENQQRVMNEFSPAKFRETLQLVLDRTGQ